MHPFAAACIILVNGIKQRSYRAYIFIEFKRGRSAGQVIRQLYRASLTNSPSKRSIHRWYNAFKSGRENLNYDPRGGRPCT